MGNQGGNTRFKKGQSGNPNGRPPKGYSITEMMRSMLDARPDIKDSIGKQIAKKALEGDINAIKMLWQYMDGMPQQSIDHTTLGKQLPAPIYGSKSVNKS